MNSVSPWPAQALEHEIWRIDTAYVKPGVAACYLLRGGDDYALIECGTGLSVQPIMQALKGLGVAPEAVRYLIPTHVHLDHAGGAGGLMQALPEAQLLVHPRGLRHLIDPGKLLAGARAVYGEAQFKAANGEVLAAPAQRSHPAPDGFVLDLGGRSLELRDAPGHAKHHLVVWDERSRGFFTGDVFGLCYPQLNIGERPFIVPTTTPVQFDPVAWPQTLAMMQAYRPLAMYLTHYGRVAASAELFAQLQERLKAHAALAREHRAADEASLARVLGDDLYARYRRSGGASERAEFDAVLGMDLALNAQGLQVWLKAA